MFSSEEEALGYKVSEYNERSGVYRDLRHLRTLKGIVDDILNAKNPKRKDILEYLKVGRRICVDYFSDEDLERAME